MGDTTAPSGRFLLRIDPALHALLRDQAEAAGLSLNELCARKLARPGTGTSGPAAEAVQRAASVTEGGLAGVLLFGSWARGDAGDRSDVDLLVVVAPHVAIERALYRRWDEEPLRWEGRRVEPHFVHLPEPGARVTGLWAEAAVDGVVLFDPDLSLSRRLVEVRRRIVSRRLVRREVHGHPYWVEAA